MTAEAVRAWLVGATTEERCEALRCEDAAVVQAIWQLNTRLSVAGMVSRIIPAAADVALLEAIDIGT